MKRYYLKGFANFGAIPVTEDSAEAYKVAGEVVRLTGARSCAVTDNKEPYEIPGDDKVYDSGSEWKSTDLVVTVNEMALKTMAAMMGIDMQDGTGELEEGIYDDAPDYALTYSALLANGGYRLYRYYATKLVSCKVSHTTKGDSNDAQTYELNFKCVPREFDGKIRGTKDVDKGEKLTWLDTIPALPETPVVPQEG